MPAGYEKIRDALIRKGKDEKEAKGMAAAIWNKHHPDNPVTRKHHMKSMEDLIEFLSEMPLEGGGHGGYGHKKKEKPKIAAPDNVAMGGENFNLCCIEPNQIILGLPSDKVTRFARILSEADRTLAERLQKYGMVGHLKRLGLPTSPVEAPSTQLRAPISAPIPTHAPPRPNTNPNAGSSYDFPEHIRATLAEQGIKTVSPNTLNLPPPPEQNRIALLNQLAKIRERNAVRQADLLRRKRMVARTARPSSYYEDRGLISAGI